MLYHYLIQDSVGLMLEVQLVIYGSKKQEIAS
jgi:hypothetical protein